MIKSFIFVEDGSVNLDELKSSVGDDVLVISYRQGATPPAIQQPREPVSRREANIKGRLLDLMIEFDEMGFTPTTVCEDAEEVAVKWKEQVVEGIEALEAKITTLWHKVDETKTDAIMQKNRADMLKEKNTNLQEGVKKAVEDVAERIKMALYYEFDELILSTTADKIDEMLRRCSMNTSYKCNCCAKESVCKYSEEYKHDCEQIQKNIVGKTTEVRIVCSEFAPVAPTVREGLK